MVQPLETAVRDPGSFCLPFPFRMNIASPATAAVSKTVTRNKGKVVSGQSPMRFPDKSVSFDKFFWKFH